MNDWFTIKQINRDTYIVSEYRHWEETHCYFLNGIEYSLLIDTGLGICNIYNDFFQGTPKKLLKNNEMIDICITMQSDIPNTLLPCMTCS